MYEDGLPTFIAIIIGAAIIGAFIIAGSVIGAVLAPLF